MNRGSGILLHITSLPSSYGIGDLGPEAYRFVDFLARSRQSYWQVLPLNPIDPAQGNSPYSSFSAFARNTLLISPDLLVKDGTIAPRDLEPMPDFPEGRCDYPAVMKFKERLFNVAYENFKEKQARYGFENFCAENSYWLENFSLFASLKERFQKRPWNEWPAEYRDRNPEALRRVRNELRDRIEKESFLQYLFAKQWRMLKRYCNERGIQIMGDIPIYVNYDGEDVWSNTEIFKLNGQKLPALVAGVPPDYFSKTGQLWGNPVYNWEALQQRGFRWWIRRMENTLATYDIVRIDHFRGLVACWEVPAGEKTAINGKWEKVPVESFLNVLKRRFFTLPIIAEDLGLITPEVREVMIRHAIPGMKVLLFAFNEDHPMHPYLPHTYEKNSVVYTGTHDNNTVRGWLENEATEEDKRRLQEYFGRTMSMEEIPWEMIRLAMLSVADIVLFPLQDVLGLGAEARLNRPSVAKGNWEWRVPSEKITSALEERLAAITQIFGRAPMLEHPSA